MSSNNRNAKIKLISSMFIFGTIGIFVRYIPLSSSIIALARGLLGTLCLLLFLYVKKTPLSKSAIKQNLPILFLSGAFIGINWIFLFEAYRYTTVATATLCYYMAPFLVIIASVFLLKESMSWTKGVCVAMALIGMLLVSGVLEGGLSTNITGILFGLGAAVFYSSVIILNKYLKNISSLDRTILQLGMATFVLLPYTLLTENISNLTLTPMAVLMLIIVGLIHTGMSYAMYFGSITNLKAQTVAIFSYIDPLVAILISALVLKEPMSLLSVVGAVLILGSTLFSYKG